jgi:hypothetical protein
MEVKVHAFLDIGTISEDRSWDTQRRFVNSRSAMAQAVLRRPFTAAAWVRAQVNPVGQSGNGTGFSPTSSVFPCQCHFTVGSTFQKIRKKKGSFIHSLLHLSSSGDGQKARKSGRSPVRR